MEWRVIFNYRKSISLERQSVRLYFKVFKFGENDFEKIEKYY